MREYHFTNAEFACKCGCGFDARDVDLLEVLEDSRDYFSKKYNEKVIIAITSGNRCVLHNEEVQKKYVKDYIPFSSKSQHILAKACDHKHFRIVNGHKFQIDPKEVYDYYDKKYPNSKGVGLYSNRVHIDVRKSKARWDETD